MKLNPSRTEHRSLETWAEGNCQVKRHEYLEMVILFLLTVIVLLVTYILANETGIRLPRILA
mgnify:CR=1 FL=1